MATLPIITNRARPLDSKQHATRKQSGFASPIAAVKRSIRTLFDVLLTSLVKLLLLGLPTARRNTPVRRSLWAGTPILTLSVTAQAERMLGVEAHSLVYQPYFITNRFDFNLSRWHSMPIVGRLLPYAVLLWACLRYQRFHFFYSHGILPSLRPFHFNQRELKLLRKLGKEVFFWPYGADVRFETRTRTLGPTNCCTDCPAPGQFCVCDEGSAQENFERIRKYATAVFSMGDMLEYTPGSRNDLFHWPIDLDADSGQRFAPVYPDPDSQEPTRVVHSPNHRWFKGTRFLLDAIDNMRRDGINIELTLIERMPNDQALEMAKSADIVFDQCLIGFHGYTALEAMAMGKPVLTFIRKPEYLLCPEECPMLSASADQLESVLRKLVADRSRLQRLGIEGRAYIEKHFTLAAFSERLATAYADLPAAA